MATQTVDTCEHCWWFAPSTSQCNRFPRTVVFRMTPPTLLYELPVVAADDCCGYYARNADTHCKD